MGFLDHSTNNILVDAVLTTEGRESLADGTFDISFFAFGDDEIDYSVIKQYGKTVGKEKIEKNTPIFEALTNSSVALKYQLLNITPSTVSGIYFYPLGSFNGSDLTGNIAKMSTTNKTSLSAINFTINMTENNLIPIEFRNSTYQIEVNDSLLSVSNAIAGSEFQYPDGTTVYELGTSDASSPSKQSTQINLALKNGLNSNTTFSLYKTSATTFIRTYVTVIHVLSGLRKSLEVNIYNTNI